MFCRWHGHAGVQMRGAGIHGPALGGISTRSVDIQFVCEKKKTVTQRGALRKAGLWAAGPFATSKIRSCPPCTYEHSVYSHTII